MNIYLDSFLTFMRIGLFTIGGGYAMIPLIEADVVEKKRWVGKEEFLDLMAIAQSCPGIFAVNISIFIGYKLRGVRGSLACTLGTILPAFVIMLCIALFFQQLRGNATVESIFRGIRPAVVALIAAPVFKMARGARITRTNVWIPVVAALLIWQFGVSPIYIIIAAGLGGYLYGRYVQTDDNE
ncbi:MAG: chromate transporter [Clostridium sp.]|nr:chromate transporter [Clostridium sp.]